MCSTMTCQSIAGQSWTLWEYVCFPWLYCFKTPSLPVGSVFRCTGILEQDPRAYREIDMYVFPWSASLRAQVVDKVLMISISSVLLSFLPFHPIPLVWGCHEVHWVSHGELQKDYSLPSTLKDTPSGQHPKKKVISTSENVVSRLIDLAFIIS